MITPGNAARFERLVQKIYTGSNLVRVWELQGGLSARVTALEIERPGGFRRKMVVRQPGAADLKQNPETAADEFKLLQILKSAGLPTPVPLYLDQSGELFATPYIVLEYIEGVTEFAPSNLADLILQLSTNLAMIHSIDVPGLDLSFLPTQAKIYAEKLSERPVRLDESLQEGRIREALDAVWPPPELNKSVLLHGDYWPGNVLWKDGHLVAVIDWEAARFGDPLDDLGNSRLEVLWAFGIEAMYSFTQHYQSMIKLDFTNLPYWDLCAALRPAFKIAEWAGNDATEKMMREHHRLFVEQALEKLPIQRTR